MLSMVDLRRIAATLSAEMFEQQLGPFALIQRPPDEVTRLKALQLGASRTVALDKNRREDEAVGLLFEFDELQVATPPGVEDGDLVLGRSPDCELVIDDPSVSKHHARLGWDAAARAAWVEDQKSSNGTWLNGAELQRRATVRDGDTLTFGEARFCFLHSKTLFSRLTTGKYKG
jgi:FHA domain